MRKIILIVLSLSVLNCGAEEVALPSRIAHAEFARHHYSAPHLGTVVRLVFYAESKNKADVLARNCFKRIHELNAILSDYSPDSELSLLCAKPIGVEHKVSDELFTVIFHAQIISSKSNGAFDITLGRQTQAWRDRAELVGDSAPPASYLDIKLNHDKKTITLQKALKIDLGGIGKGYIGDQLMRILKRAGVNHAAVIIGGETLLAAAPPGKKGWHIGVENSEHEVVGKMLLENVAISTSGDSYQFFEADGNRQSHLIDPASKKSKIDRLNVTTIARTSMMADAWATALRILPMEESLKIANQEPELEALFIPHKQKTTSTKNFPKLQLQ